MDEQNELLPQANEIKSKTFLEHEEIKLRWYQAKLGFWQALWGTLITGGLAIAIPQGVEAYKTRQEIALKNLQMDHEYIKTFMSQAVAPDIDLRIRLSQYFSYISSNEHRDGWEKFRVILEKRRGELQEQIINENKGILRIKSKPSLGVEDIAQVDELQRRRDWYESELGKIGAVPQR
jgi:hypothetical protein